MHTYWNTIVWDRAYSARSFGRNEKSIEGGAERTRLRQRRTYTVVLSKSALSGPSVCQRARAPCTLAVSRSPRGPCRAQQRCEDQGIGTALSQLAGLHACLIDADSQSVLHRWTEISQLVIMFQLFGSIEVCDKVIDQLRPGAQFISGLYFRRSSFSDVVSSCMSTFMVV